ncbi:MAG: serine/threonine protein kinase, partial [Deltaproteobacteria bacterium]|nr:serine/threonine protein kinase [Deltaproteobacteria bacterium]
MRNCLECGLTTEGLFCPTDGMATIVPGVVPKSGELPLSTVFAGRYRIVGTLGKGGMGAVYDAQHTGTGQKVAVKTLLIDTVHDPAAVKRFFLEAKITAGLQHPNTIRVFDFGQSDDGLFYLAMERLQGVTLADRLAEYSAQGKRMSEQEAATIACAALRSLAEAHRVNLVHRDLKPSNLFLHDLGAGETVIKVLDFGIAKSGDQQQQLTQAGTALGTPAYMSPEQVMGRAVDARSDLYSLGVVLYQCVSGRVPFRGDSTFTVLMMQVNDAPPDLSQVAGVSAAFASVVGKSLAKAAEERYESATAMREALEPLARGEHLHAPGAAGIAPAKVAVPPPPPAAPANRDHASTRPPAPVQGLEAAPPLPARAVRGSTHGGVKPPEPPPRRSLAPLYLFGFLAVVGSLAVAFWLHGRGPSAGATEPPHAPAGAPAAPRDRAPAPAP